MEGTAKVHLEVGQNKYITFFPSKFTDLPDLEACSKGKGLER